MMGLPVEALLTTVRGQIPVAELAAGDRILTADGWTQLQPPRISEDTPMVDVVGYGGALQLAASTQLPVLTRVQDNGTKYRLVGSTALRLHRLLWGTPCSLPPLPVDFPDLAAPEVMAWVLGRALRGQPGRPMGRPAVIDNRLVLYTSQLDWLSIVASERSWEVIHFDNRFVIVSDALVKWVREQVGYSGIIPTWVYGQPRQVRLAFLNGIFDGWVGSGRRRTLRFSGLRSAVAFRLLGVTAGLSASIYTQRGEDMYQVHVSSGHLSAKAPVFNAARYGPVRGVRPALPRLAYHFDTNGILANGILLGAVT